MPAVVAREVSEAAARILLQPNLAAVTTLRADGSPHTTVVWVDWDGEHVVFNTTETRAKTGHLRADPRASVLVLDRNDPYRWVSVSGIAVELTQEGAVEHINRLAHSTSAATSRSRPASSACSSSCARCA